VSQAFKDPAVTTAIEDALASSNLKEQHQGLSAAVALGLEGDIGSVASLPSTIAALQTQSGAFKMSPDSRSATSLASGYALSCLGMLAQLELPEMQTAALTGVASKLSKLFLMAKGTEQTAIFEVPPQSEDASSTSLIIQGSTQLTKALGSTSPISEELQTRFVQHFLEARSSLDLEEAVHAMRGLRALSGGVRSKDATSTPSLLCVTLENSDAMTTSSEGEEGFIQVSLTDPFGVPVGRYSVIARSIHGTRSDSPVLNEESLDVVPCTSGPGCLPTRYRLDFLSTPREKDVYSIVLALEKDTATPQEEGKATTDELDLSEFEVERMFKLTVEAHIKDFELKVASHTDWDAVKAESFTYPEVSDRTLSLGKVDNLKLNFKVQDKDGKPYELHQLFFRLSHKTKDTDQVLIPKLVGDGEELIMMSEDISSTLKYEPGSYSLDLLLGDIYLKDNRVWHVCDLDVQTEDAPFKQAPLDVPILTLLPEISHTFEPPEARPNGFFGLVVGCLVPVPLLVFLQALVGLDAFTFAKFPSASEEPTAFMTSVAFQGGLLATLVLFFFYWLGLGLLQTVSCLFPLLIFNMVVGHRALAYLVEPKASKSKVT